MKILIINCILSTAEHGIIKTKESISDCMISNFARGFVELGHQVTLLASADFKPTGSDDIRGSSTTATSMTWSLPASRSKCRR